LRTTHEQNTIIKNILPLISLKKRYFLLIPSFFLNNRSPLDPAILLAVDLDCGWPLWKLMMKQSVFLPTSIQILVHIFIFEFVLHLNFVTPVYLKKPLKNECVSATDPTCEWWVGGSRLGNVDQPRWCNSNATFELNNLTMTLTNMDATNYALVVVPFTYEMRARPGTLLAHAICE
jgi:hypothetical protein